MNPPLPTDAEAVRALLGREPEGDFEVIVRDASGQPVVIRNAPLLHDGRPMPTRYWLVGRSEVVAVSRLEASGGVRRAEAEVAAGAVADAHRRYAAERDAAMPADHTGPRPSGGVAGTREGVKCLHAHYAWYLAGGDDPVGRWVADQLGGRVHLTVHATSCAVTIGSTAHSVPVGTRSVADELDGDPPRPESLTNAIGIVTDHIDDLVRAVPAVAGAAVTMHGPAPRAIAAVEVGGVVDGPFVLDRAAAEDVFRTLATEPARTRARNPGLPADMVDEVVAGCCILVAVMRRLHLTQVVVEGVDVEGVDG